MTGLRGLLLTSTTGAKLTCTPSARVSSPVTRPASNASVSSPRGAERHQPRERGRAHDAEADACLEVRRVEQRHARHLLQPVQRRRRLERLTERHGPVGGIQQHRRRELARAEHVKAADAILANGFRERVEPFGVGAEKAGLKRRAPGPDPTLSSRVIFFDVVCTHFSAALSRGNGSRRLTGDDEGQGDDNAKGSHESRILLPRPPARAGPGRILRP